MTLGGGALALLILAYVYGLEPLRDARQETRTQLEAARLRAGRYEQLLARRDRLGQDLADLGRRREALRGRLLQGPTPAIAAAELQEIVKAQASQVNLVVQRMSVERPSATDRVTDVPIRVNLKGEIRPVSALIKQLEQHRLALSIPELTIQVQDPKNPQDLMIDLVVAGYLVLPEEASPTKRPGATAAKEGSSR